jgi:hypothetical protein
MHDFYYATKRIMDLWDNSFMDTASTDSKLYDFWERLLSRKPEQIENTFQILTGIEQQAVITHLARMRDEDGWLMEQRLSATAALEVIQDLLAGEPS